MSQIPFSLEFVRSASARQRTQAPLSSAQRHFSDWLQQPIVEGCTEAAQDFEQDRDAQRQKRQQLILQALQRPGGCYRDQQRLVRREPGMCLSWRLLNGPLVGLRIRAELVNSQLHLVLSVSEWSHYLRLLSQRSSWLEELSQCSYPVSLEIFYGVSGA